MVNRHQANYLKPLTEEQIRNMRKKAILNLLDKSLTGQALSQRRVEILAGVNAGVEAIRVQERAQAQAAQAQAAEAAEAAAAEAAVGRRRATERVEAQIAKEARRRATERVQAARMRGAEASQRSVEDRAALIRSHESAREQHQQGFQEVLERERKKTSPTY
jgi:hypothetical protein